MKGAILGAGGQLGTDLQRVMADWDVIPFRHAGLDIGDHKSVLAALTLTRPSIVINQPHPSVSTKPDSR
ncbi:MAG TPA: sugar nucleotide-binding protein [Anaerolineales bacterium]|nr:sugar nucleotide-binding protein [Anaerolineales bacterium]